MSQTTGVQRMREDRDAVLDMPFRLVIVTISFALVAPAVIGGWSAIDYVQTEQRIRSELQRVLMAGQRYAQIGIGGETLELSLRGGVHSRVEYVILGDEPDGAYSHAARFRISGGQEQVMIPRNPSIAMHSRDGKGFKMAEGSYTVEIECFDESGITIRLV